MGYTYAFSHERVTPGTSASAHVFLSIDNLDTVLPTSNCRYIRARLDYWFATLSF